MKRSWKEIMDFFSFSKTDTIFTMHSPSKRTIWMNSSSLNTRFWGRLVPNDYSIIEDNTATKCVKLDALKYKLELEDCGCMSFSHPHLHYQHDRKRNYDVHSEMVISQNIRCLIINKTSSSICNKSNNVNDQSTTIWLVAWISTTHSSNYKREGETRMDPSWKETIISRKWRVLLSYIGRLKQIVEKSPFFIYNRSYMTK